MTAKYLDLKNKRVFITGGGSGIGASIVQHFCEQESEVYFVDINEEASNKLISDCKNKKLSIPNFIKCDLFNIKELQSIITKIISDKGPINILINSAANDERHAIDDDHGPSAVHHLNAIGQGNLENGNVQDRRQAQR